MPTPPVTSRAYGILREVEDAHWWFDAMERITARVLDAHAGAQPRTGVRMVADAGCGTGRNLGFLGRHYESALVTGLDHSLVALGHCRERGFTRLVCGSLNALPFAPETFDLVTSFDVLTARTIDDEAALAGMARLLRPGGRLLVRVAAYDWLRSRHDVEWDIGRRYRRGELRAKLERAGLEVQVASYANTWLFPVALLKRLLERWFPPKDENSDLQLGAGRGMGARILHALMASEARWVAAGSLPCGLSLYAHARKPAAAGAPSPNN